MKYEIQYVDGLFQVKSSGDAELQCFKDLMEDLFSHEQWRPDGTVLVDHTELNTAPLSTEELLEIATFGKVYRKQVGKTKFAILVNRDLEFGMGRMWQVFTTDGRESLRRIFRSRDEAVSWLKEE